MRKAIRRFAALILPVLLLFGLSVPVFATESNAFFNAHAAECRTDGGSYILNGEKGFAAVLTAPDGQAQDYLLNEQPVTVFGFWRDGEGRDWAQLRYTPDEAGYALSDVDGERIGWLDSALLIPVPDKSSFVEAHFDEFVQSEVALIVKNWNGILLWPYPGSGGQGYDLGWSLHEDTDTLRFPAYWVDSLGRRWGAYTCGEKDGFLCLDDPFARENLLPEIGLPAHTIPAVIPERLPAAPAVTEADPSSLPYVLGIAALSALSLFLVRKLLRERGKTAEED